MMSVLTDGRTLIHCDAGRDRTGWMSALLSMIVFESYNKADEGALDAVECDYRKTDSLKEYKYGRMAAFFRKITESSSVADFLQTECNISKSMTSDVAVALSAEGS
jgi:protein tyrosine/serine phosphatase